MPNQFWTSDNHFFHANVINYSQRIYNDVEEMNESLIKNWNSVVKKGDVVYHLGDFGFANDDKLKTIIKRLNGSKHLILGNHDKSIRKHKNNFLGYPLFDTIQDYKEVSVDGQKIIMCHYALRTWNRMHYGSWALHGHSHGSLQPFGKSVDVGVDSKFILGDKTEYRPFHFEEMKKFMDARDFIAVDHHIQNNEEY